MITLTNGILIVVGLLILWGVVLFNGLVRMRFRVREAWSDIEVQLKRRFDLIPNLVETVKGYMTHEKEVFEHLAEARAQSLSARGREERGTAEGTLAATLKTIFAVSEQYPELKANTNFIELQRELADTENKLQAARRFYNGVVMDYNTRIHMFPSVLIASIFHFMPEEFFQLEEPAAQQPISVAFK